MPITSGDGYLASVKQRPVFTKKASRTATAATETSIFDLAGNPGAGTLSAGNTANGIVPTDALAGYPIIEAFGGTNEGYISRIEFGNSVICNLRLYDRVFSAGAYAFNADVTLASQPSYAARIPHLNYNGLELWAETVTAFTGNPSFQVNYLDQGGAAGDTGVIASGAALILGRCFRLPLAAGDSGIQRIDRVRGSVATVGTFNINVLRPLWQARVPIANFADIHDFLKTGMVRIYESSALFLLVQPDSTATGLPYLNIEVAVG